jgi:hypothetical protein
MQSDPQELLNQLIPFMAFFGVVALACYVFFGILLTILANKTNTPNAWMAWVPVLSAILLCRIGRRSPWLILLLIVPLVNIAVLIFIFMGVCEARGKPPIAGLLMLVPVVNFFVLIWLASGPASGAMPAPAPQYSYQAPQSSGCTRCGNPFGASEMYCCNCGAPRPAVSNTPPAYAPAPPPSQPALKGSGVKFAIFAGVAILVIFGGLYAVTRMITSSGSRSLTTRLPERPSGVLTEFPVDTDRQNPAKPVSVSSVRLRGERVTLPRSMPPGLTPSLLDEMAESVSTASYSTSPNDPPVDVHVIESDKPNAETQIAEAVINGGGGATTDVEVQVTSPTGQVYRGRKIRTALGALVYVLKKVGTGLITVIQAVSPLAVPLADRLAANVGNGGGLYDYAQVTGAVGLLPPPPPIGLSLLEMKSYTGSDLVNVEEMPKTLTGDVDSIRRFLPARLTTMRYADSSRREWKVLTGDFGSPIKSWATWSALRFWSKASGLQSVSADGLEGLTMVQDNERLLLLRNGSVMTLVIAPQTEALDRVTAFGNQIAR